MVVDPAEEIAYQHLIFCSMATGDQQAAQRQYEACVRALRAELAVEPDSATVALYWRSQQPHVRKSSPAAAQNNLPLPLASFIGREQAIAKLKTLLLGDPKRASVSMPYLG